MQLPFTIDQFFNIFRLYNEAVWPAQIALNAIGLLCVALIMKRGKWSDRSISFFLALLWAWTAIVYHFSFFSGINPAAYGFGFIFLIEAVLLFWLGVFRSALQFGSKPAARAITGAALLSYSLVIYPLVNIVFAHSYPDAPTFGVPCPTTIFTIGIFFFLKEPFSRKILWIPILWSIIGSIGAILLDVPADFGLPVAALLALFLLPERGEKRKKPLTAAA